MISKLRKLRKDLSTLRETSKKKHKKTYYEKFQYFIKDCDSLFDIKADPARQKTQEDVWGVKIGKEEETLYEN